MNWRYCFGEIRKIHESIHMNSFTMTKTDTTSGNSRKKP
jgi:hypothetical protein